MTIFSVNSANYFILQSTLLVAFNHFVINPFLSMYRVSRLNAQAIRDSIFFFTYIPCILIVSKLFYSPTDAQVNCLENNFKIYVKINIKTALTCFGAVTQSSGSFSVQLHNLQGAFRCSYTIFRELFGAVTNLQGAFRCSYTIFRELFGAVTQSSGSLLNLQLLK